MAQQSTPTSGHGVSAGVIAGAVVGTIAFLALSISLFLWWRRRNAVPVQPAVPEAKDIPAPADTVLNRPDPTEKIMVTPESVPAQPIVRVYADSNSTINLDPSSQSSSPRRNSSHSNPFGDGHSIQTASISSQSTNVIPIAFVPPPASVLPVGSKPQPGSITSLPPHRMVGAELNIDHMNLSSDSVPVNPSGATVMADDRSYITNASYASDVLSEVPTIVTGRLVASAAKAAVVPTSARSLTSRPSTRSPLTASSFGPQDVLREAGGHPLPVPADPFADERSPGFRSSMATRGSSQAPQDWNATSTEPSWIADSDINDPDRPLSTYTQAASIIGANIMDATRVHLGFAQPASASIHSTSPVASPVSTSAGTLVRVASGRLVSPSTSGSTNNPGRQLESALADAQLQVQQPEKGQASPYRISMSTVASGVSGRADSILESFTFVPPSPISNRPLRTPPRSPLSQETPNVPCQPAPVYDDSDLEPPNRQVLGMSTGSQLSAMSTGLGSFPFQIDHGGDCVQDEEPPVEVLSNVKIDAKQRASLDTLALTKDLASYPLGFDRQSKESFAAFMANKS